MTDLIKLHRQAQDYFLKGISLRFLSLGNGDMAYKTGVPNLNFIYIQNVRINLSEILREASDVGFGVDQKMGFKTLFKSNNYSSKKAENISSK